LVFSVFAPPPLAYVPLPPALSTGFIIISYFFFFILEVGFSLSFLLGVVFLLSSSSSPKDAIRSSIMASLGTGAGTAEVGGGRILLISSVGPAVV